MMADRRRPFEAGLRPGRRLRSVRLASALAAVGLLAMAMRSIGFEWIFVGDEVLLVVPDGHYQARRAFYTFARFPELLTFDPYVNYPDGAVLPMPPLVTFLLGAVARVFGDDVSTFERVLAWSSPVVGALTVLPVYAAARALAPPSVALGAAALFAVLPVVVHLGAVGDADHHALVVAVSATLLAVCLAFLSPAARGARLLALAAALALVRVILLLSWSGSILPVALADGLLLVAVALGGRLDRALALAASAAVSALCVLPVVLALPTPLAGPFTALVLSFLHVALGLGVATLAGAFAAFERMRPAGGTVGRLVRMGALGVVMLGLLLAHPGFRAGVLPAMAFVGTDVTVGGVVLELMPLFPLFGRPAAQSAVHHYGYFVWLLPLAPLAPLLAIGVARRFEAALFLAAWTLAWGLLAVWQTRFGGDFAPAASIAFALLLAGVLRVVARPLHLPSAARIALAVALSLALLVVPIRRDMLPRGRASLAALAGEAYPGDPALATPSGSLIRFLQAVRRVTPDTSGFLDPSVRPEYGILVPARIGHPLHWVARRPAPANGFLHVIGRENYEAAQRFYALGTEEEALAVAARLETPYVVTMHFPAPSAGAFATRLQQYDGLGPGEPTGRFRLVTEGPPGGRPLSDLLGMPRPEHVVAYKLFEVVEGAVLEIAGAPGASVRASLGLRTPTRRRLEVVHSGRVGEDGFARLRVAYPSDVSAPVAALGPWRVRVGRASHTVDVSEQDVRRGARVPVAVPSPRKGAHRGSRRGADA